MDRIRELDGVRGLAALVILIYHLRPGGTIPYGWASVDVFFVLSGYLITAIILRHQDSVGFVRAFYFRRALRIWPPYLLAILVLVVVDSTVGDRVPMTYLPPLLTFTQGLPWLAPAGTPLPGYFGHSWTLAIEEQFYLIWPALLVICGRRAVVPLAVGFMLLSVSTRALGVYPYLLVSRCDGFAVGAVLAAALANTGCVGQYRAWFRAWFRLGAIGFLGMAILKVGEFRLGSYGLPISVLVALNLGSGCVVGLVVVETGKPILAILRSSPLVHLGKLSYGLYLYHAIVFYLVFRVADKFEVGPSLGRDIAALGFTWCSAALSWKFLERPMLAWKDRFPYREDSTIPTKPSPRGHLGELHATA